MRGRSLPMRVLRWLLLSALAAFAAAILFVLTMLFAPAVGPVSANALYWSVARESGGNMLSGSDGCRRQRGGTWQCDIWDPGASGTLDYRVRLSGDCWRAVRRSPPSGEGPMAKRPRACVRFRDQARPLDRLL